MAMLPAAGNAAAADAGTDDDDDDDDDALRRDRANSRPLGGAIDVNGRVRSSIFCLSKGRT